MIIPHSYVYPCAKQIGRDQMMGLGGADAGADGPENFKTQRLLQNLVNH